MFLKISGGNCLVDLPMIAGSATKICQHHLQTRAANLWDLSKAINKTLLAFGSFSQWTLIMHKPHNWVDLYADTTTDNLLELEHHAAFAKLTRWIMKTRYSKYSFALIFTQMSELNLNPSTTAIGRLFFGHKSPAARARELFKLRIQQVF